MRKEYISWSCGKMGHKKLAKRADIQKVEGKWRRRRPELQWGIALSDLDIVGEWKK